MADSQQNMPVEDIVRLVLSEINKRGGTTVVSPNGGSSQPAAQPQPVGPSSRISPSQIASQGDTCLFDNLDDAVEAARLAQRRFIDLSLERRMEIVANIRKHALANAERLGRLAVTETGLGRMPDKMNKIIL